jgi:hypothetical protein
VEATEVQSCKKSFWTSCPTQSPVEHVHIAAAIKLMSKLMGYCCKPHLVVNIHGEMDNCNRDAEQRE